MAVNPVTSTTSQQNNSTTQKSASALSLDPNAFLKILIADMQNQDPLNPSSPEDFMSQLAQLTQVQQLTNIATGISSLTQSNQQGSIAQWLSVVGKKVDVQDNALSAGDQVTLQPQGSYDQVILTVNHSDGNMEQIKFNNGDALTYKYNGTDNATFGVSATLNGAPLSCGVEVSRTVQGIQTTSSGIQIVFGDGKTMPVTAITQISQ
jgi:flagellar basal-body rod modification protein FlgD